MLVCLGLWLYMPRRTGAAHTSLLDVWVYQHTRCSFVLYSLFCIPLSFKAVAGGLSGRWMGSGGKRARVFARAEVPRAFVRGVWD